MWPSFIRCILAYHCGVIFQITDHCSPRAGGGYLTPSPMQSPFGRAAAIHPDDSPLQSAIKADARSPVGTAPTFESQHHLDAVPTKSPASQPSPKRGTSLLPTWAANALSKVTRSPTKQGLQGDASKLVGTINPLPAPAAPTALNPPQQADHVGSGGARDGGQEPEWAAFPPIVPLKSVGLVEEPWKMAGDSESERGGSSEEDEEEEEEGEGDGGGEEAEQECQDERVPMSSLPALLQEIEARAFLDRYMSLSVIQEANTDAERDESEDERKKGRIGGGDEKEGVEKDKGKTSCGDASSDAASDDEVVRRAGRNAGNVKATLSASKSVRVGTRAEAAAAAAVAARAREVEWESVLGLADSPRSSERQQLARPGPFNPQQMQEEVLREISVTADSESSWQTVEKRRQDLNREKSRERTDDRGRGKEKEREREREKEAQSSRDKTKEQAGEVSKRRHSRGKKGEKGRKKGEEKEQDKVDVAALMQAVAELTKRLEAEEEEGRRLRDKVSVSEDEDEADRQRRHACTHYELTSLNN